MKYYDRNQDLPWNESILDFDLGGKKNVGTLAITVHSIDAKPLFAGYFMLQAEENWKCSSASTCNSGCIRVVGIDLNETIQIPHNTVETIFFAFESPSTCGELSLYLPTSSHELVSIIPG